MAVDMGRVARAASTAVARPVQFVNLVVVCPDVSVFLSLPKRFLQFTLQYKAFSVTDLPIRRS